MAAVGSTDSERRDGSSHHSLELLTIMGVLCKRFLDSGRLRIDAEVFRDSLFVLRMSTKSRHRFDVAGCWDWIDYQRATDFFFAENVGSRPTGVQTPLPPACAMKSGSSLSPDRSG
jgi:hypothetical protein